MRAVRIAAVAVGLVLAASAAPAAVVFVDLGTDPPPGFVGPIGVQPFNRSAQNAIPEGTVVTEIPGSPVPGTTLTADIPLLKLNIGSGWQTWSHGYKGPVFATFQESEVTLTTPHTRAFYAYVEPNNFNVFNVTVTTDIGGTSG